MAEIREVKDGDVVLARHVPASVAWVEGLTFFSHDRDFIQFGVWGYDRGEQVEAHSHNLFSREVLWTQEVIYVRSGRIRAHVYDTADRPVTTIEAGPGDILALLRGGHGYDILEDGTHVLEVKNGPYSGPHNDRRRF